MGNLSGESGEQNHKDKVTRFRSVTYARELRVISKYSREPPCPKIYMENRPYLFQ